MRFSILKLFVPLFLAMAVSAFAQEPAAGSPSAPETSVETTLPTPPKIADSNTVVESVPEEVMQPRGASAVLDEMIQAKLDSIDQNVTVPMQVNTDSLAQVRADSIRQLILEGKYVKRARYDKSNFDHWRKDTVFQKAMKEIFFGVWRTPIVAHGHSFRDAELRFGMNDTLYSITRTYSDSGRYQMTGEYTYKAKYRFDNDTSMVTREVFKDRQVIRWDFVTFRILGGDTLQYNLNKLEFRDLNDNWLNALQGFDNVPPELYVRDEKASAEMKKQLEKSKPKK